MAVLYLLYVLVVLVGLFVVPGMLVVRLLAPGKYEEAPVAMGAAVGVGLVCYVALTSTGFLGLAVPLYLTGPVAAAFSLAVTLLSALGLRLREKSFGYWRELFLDLPRRVWNPRLFAFLLLVFLLYLVGYDSSLFDQERCISRACLLPVHDYLHPDPPIFFDGCLDCFEGRNAFFLWNGRQRMGPSVFVAPFVGLFGFPGFRLVHAVMGLFAGWFGFHLGRKVFGHAGYGYATALLLACNPLALGIPLVDENILCLALGAALFYVLLESPTQWLFAGLFFGLFIGVRHVGLLSLPAVLYAALTNRDRPHYKAAWYHRIFGTEPVANVTATLLAIGLFSLPWLFVHGHAWFRGLPLYESFAALPATDHEILGFQFSLRGLLSWPFTPVPVRSPFAGYPTLIAFPLTLVKGFGILLLALVAVGWRHGWRTRRTAFVVGLLWLPVQLAMLMTMANWMEPNKMGIVVGFLQPLVLAMVAGLHRAIEAYRADRFAAPALVGAGTFLVLGGFALAMPEYKAPLDERNFRSRAAYATEVFPVTPPMAVGTEGAYAEADRQRLTRVSPLPDFRELFVLSKPRFLGAALAQLWRDLGAPRGEDYCPRPKDWLYELSGIPDETSGETVPLARMMHRPVSRFRRGSDAFERCFPRAEPGPTRVVRLDLSRLPTESGFLETVLHGPPDLPVSTDGLLLAHSMQPAWSEGIPVHAAVLPGAPGVTWLMLWYGNYRFDHLGERPEVKPLHPDGAPARHGRVPDGTLLRVVDISSAAPNRFHIQLGRVGERLELDGPWPSSY